MALTVTSAGLGTHIKFFRGHANKLAFDVLRFTLAQATGPSLSRGWDRLQWDVHF